MPRDGFLSRSGKKQKKLFERVEEAEEKTIDDARFSWSFDCLYISTAECSTDTSDRVNPPPLDCLLPPVTMSSQPLLQSAPGKLPIGPELAATEGQQAEHKRMDKGLKANH